LNGVHYLKDNRVLPRGFDKRTAEPDVAVHGDAADDPGFTGGAARVRYAVPVPGEGPFTVEAELLYQPIGFRWTQNPETVLLSVRAAALYRVLRRVGWGATATLASTTR